MKIKKLGNFDLLRFKVFVCFLCSTIVYGQEKKSDIPEMVTDRPDVTESSKVMPKGYLQVETGGFYESSTDGQTSEKWVYNTSLVRYGILDNLELRLGWDLGQEKLNMGDQNSKELLNGFSPLLIGAKVSITEEEGALPEIALLGHLFLPFLASSDFRPRTTGVDFSFAFSHSLNERSDFSYNLGVEWMDGSPEAIYIYSLAYGYSLTDNFGAYAELYGGFPENDKAGHFCDMGITYLLRRNIQLDAYIGTGISKGQDFLLGAGFSFRVPN